jgi:large subunit ribosomal protein L9
MEVILLQDVEKIGKSGDTLKVKDGFARNFLLPKGLAFKATGDGLRRIEEIKKHKAKILDNEHKQSLVLKDKLEAVSLTIAVQIKDDEEIYGSITEAQIVKGLAEEGIELDRNQLVLAEPIKKIGVYNLKVKLHSQTEANLRVWVVKK